MTNYFRTSPVTPTCTGNYGMAMVLLDTDYVTSVTQVTVAASLAIKQKREKLTKYNSEGRVRWCMEH